MTLGYWDRDTLSDHSYYSVSTTHLRCGAEGRDKGLFFFNIVGWTLLLSVVLHHWKLGSTSEQELQPCAWSCFVSLFRVGRFFFFKRFVICSFFLLVCLYMNAYNQKRFTFYWVLTCKYIYIYMYKLWNWLSFSNLMLVFWDPWWLKKERKKKIESSASQYTPLLFCLRLRVCPQMWVGS